MGVDCVDVPAPGVGAVCGPCPEGYRGDGSKCAGKLGYQCILIKYFVESLNLCSHSPLPMERLLDIIIDT